jgi:anti-sigma factor RsiW
MNCDKCQTQIPEYVDGAVTKEVRDEMDAHMRTCAACASALVGERKALAQFTGRLAPELDQRRLSPAACARIAAAGSAGSRPAVSWWRSQRNLLTTAAALLILAGVSGIYGLSCKRPLTTSLSHAVPETIGDVVELTNTLSLLVRTTYMNNSADTLAINTVHRVSW